MNSILPEIHFTGPITSTFDALATLYKKGKVQIWDSVCAREQTQGRGQMRRLWISPPGNLYASIRLPDIPAFSADSGGILLGCMFATALRKFGLPIHLKWPNDLVVMDDAKPVKIGGILLVVHEGFISGGIGINLASSPPRKEIRDDAALESGILRLSKSPSIASDAPALWMRLVKEIISLYKNASNFSLNIFIEEINDLLLWKNEMVSLDDGQTFSGILKGLSPSGGVLIESDGKTREFRHGGLKASAR